MPWLCRGSHSMESFCEESSATESEVESGRCLTSEEKSWLMNGLETWNSNLKQNKIPNADSPSRKRRPTLTTTTTSTTHRHKRQDQDQHAPAPSTGTQHRHPPAPTTTTTTTTTTTKMPGQVSWPSSLTPKKKLLGFFQMQASFGSCLGQLLSKIFDFFCVPLTLLVELRNAWVCACLDTFRNHPGKNIKERAKHTFPIYTCKTFNLQSLQCNVSRTMRHCKCKPVQASFGSCLGQLLSKIFDFFCFLLTLFTWLLKSRLSPRHLAQVLIRASPAMCILVLIIIIIIITTIIISSSSSSTFTFLPPRSFLRLHQALFEPLHLLCIPVVLFLSSRHDKTPKTAVPKLQIISSQRRSAHWLEIQSSLRLSQEFCLPGIQAGSQGWRNLMISSPSMTIRHTKSWGLKGTQLRPDCRWKMLYTI